MDDFGDIILRFTKDTLSEKELPNEEEHYEANARDEMIKSFISLTLQSVIKMCEPMIESQLEEIGITAKVNVSATVKDVDMSKFNKHM